MYCILTRNPVFDHHFFLIRSPFRAPSLKSKCQTLGQVNFNFYLPKTILTIAFAIALSVLLKKYRISLVLLYFWSYMMKSWAGTLWFLPALQPFRIYLPARGALNVEPCTTVVRILLLYRILQRFLKDLSDKAFTISAWPDSVTELGQILISTHWLFWTPKIGSSHNMNRKWPLIKLCWIPHQKGEVPLVSGSLVFAKDQHRLWQLYEHVYVYIFMYVLLSNTCIKS